MKRNFLLATLLAALFLAVPWVMPSFTMGVSTSRSGLSYPMQLGRDTGLNVPSIAASGNCKMQQSFAQAIADA